MREGESLGITRQRQAVLEVIRGAEGLIGEVRFGTDASRYDRTVRRHDHAVCTACGKLIDIELKIPTSLTKKAAELSQFQPESIELILHGLCPKCRG